MHQRFHIIAHGPELIGLLAALRDHRIDHMVVFQQASHDRRELRLQGFAVRALRLHQYIKGVVRGQEGLVAPGFLHQQLVVVVPHDFKGAELAFEVGAQAPQHLQQR